MDLIEIADSSLKEKPLYKSEKCILDQSKVRTPIIVIIRNKIRPILTIGLLSGSAFI